MNFIRYIKDLWHGETDPNTIAQAYEDCFNTPPGQKVLEHLVNNVYATVYEGIDPIGLAYHNGRRSVVQDILLNREMAKGFQQTDEPVKTETVNPNRKAA